MPGSFTVLLLLLLAFERVKNSANVSGQKCHVLPLYFTNGYKVPKCTVSASRKEIAPLISASRDNATTKERASADIMRFSI